jgi:predicted DNA-binding transcriptional regulator
MADKYNPTEFKDLMNYLTRPSEDKKRMREYFETNDPVEFGKEIIRRAVPLDFSEVPVLENMSVGMSVPSRLEIGANFPVGGGELMMGAGIDGQDKSIGIGFRKEFNDGGMLVKPGLDGTRQGYAKLKEKGVTGPKGGRPIPDHVIMADDRLALKEARKKVDKLNRVNKLDDKLVKFRISKTQAGNFVPALIDVKGKPKFGSISDLKNEFNKIKKTEEFKTYSKKAAMQEGGIKSAKKQLADIGSKKPEVFNYLLNNKNATIEEIGKALKIPQGSVIKNLQGLYTDIYKRIGDQGAVYLKEFSMDNLDSVHDSIKNTKVPLKDRVKNLVIDAYKGDEDLKPLLKKLDDFYTLNNKIKKTQYGKFFAANLDHVVPLNFLRELEKGVSPKDLIRLKPIPEFLNQRAFKAQFDKVLGQAYAAKNKEALETIVNLQSYLPQEFGGITKTGKIIDYGADTFNLKTDLSQRSFGDIYNRVFEFIKNPELQDTFKEAGVSFKSLKSKEKAITKQIEPAEKQITQLLGELGCPTVKFALGGRVKFSQGSACVIKGREKLESILKKGVKVGSNDMTLANNILKAGQGLKNAFALRGLFGPAAVAFTALTEGGILGYDMLSKGKTFKEAMGDSLFNLMLGDDYRFNNDFLAKGGTFDERLDMLKFNPNQKQLINNFRTYVSEAQALGDASINVDKAQLRVKGSPVQDIFKDGPPSILGKQFTRFVKPPTGKEKKLREDELRAAIAAKQAADQSFQTRVQDIDFAEQLQSGMTEGQDLMGKAIDLAELQQLGSVDQNIYGKAFEGPIAKQKRQDRILELLPTALNFAGGGIAKQAGDPSGKPPVSGPNSQGLPGLLKRGI